MLAQIFLPLKMFVRTAVLLYVWFALMLLYYGISLGVIEDTHLIDPYLMFLLSAVAELVGYAICYVNDVLGRRVTLGGFLVVTTVVYALLAFLNHENTNGSMTGKVLALILLALVGKCAVSGAYNIAYIYTAELYVTATRNTALILLTCVGSSSSLLAPHIDKLRTHLWYPLPNLVYSGCALLAALSLSFLPETLSPKQPRKPKVVQRI
jgi:OCT family organic cation transporter-like MFS transporter 4/5